MIRVLLATGRPALDAAVASEPDLDVVAQAYYADAAVTALAELLPDVAVIDPTLPGAVPFDWFGDAALSATQVVWLGRANHGEPGARVAGGDWTPPVAWSASTIIEAIRTLMARKAGPLPPALDIAHTGVLPFVGCLPRLGVSTAAAAWAISLASTGQKVAVVDANLTHPCLPEILGMAQPLAGWDVAESPADVGASGVRTQGVHCLALSRSIAAPGNTESLFNRLRTVLAAMRDRGFPSAVVDLGSPCPLVGGRLSPWLEWVASTEAVANVITAQDPQALLAAARVLRAADAAGVAVRLWCASYDQHISSIDELSAALGRSCDPLPWDRNAVVRWALAGQPPALQMPLDFGAVRRPAPALSGR